ncbi:hypothetical protein BO78DRAFT_378087 [Aspergillus sclerotiicarbonarius CBS 121057]|uniref:F-box domain-containing protein n=1 Tax=Aspergillus sclerotiicarbonarius (strain CBS 121057 / IBT 28362) TaxID=1448318 RepID=A0A319DVW4_ASPSB|nr:hypothetical protein BO78DRAFT_378087 [Aspergillus sclerotiicarbonarius CBS 121057]
MKPKHQAAPGIISCPAEILDLVFQLLSPADLRVFGRVNKAFRNYVEPLLYSKIQWTWLKAESPPPITLLVRKILCRPQLATYITNIHFESDTFCRWSFKVVPKIPFTSELNEPIAFIRKTGVSYTDLWIQELCQGITDAWLALLLAQLPRLKCLYLSPNFTQQSKLIGMVLRSAIEPAYYGLPDFRHLRDVSFHLRVGDRSRKKRNDKNTTDVLPFFYLPSIQHLSASIENPVIFTWPAAHLPVPNLTSLDLNFVREAHLGQLLSVTQNLKTLRWAWYFDISVEDQFTTPIVDLDQIDTALSHVRDTLTDLTILAECGTGLDPFLPSIKTEGSLKSLVNFNKLKRLQIPLPFLVGFAQDTTKRLQDVIPRNIEFLVITDNLKQQNQDVADRTGWPLWEWEDHVIIDLIRLWLEDWRACTPHLRGITLRLEWTDWELDEWLPETTVQQLRDLGAQAGVEIEIIDLTDVM